MFDAGIEWDRNARIELFQNFPTKRQTCLRPGKMSDLVPGEGQFVAERSDLVLFRGEIRGLVPALGRISKFGTRKSRAGFSRPGISPSLGNQIAKVGRNRGTKPRFLPTGPGEGAGHRGGQLSRGCFLCRLIIDRRTQPVILVVAGVEGNMLHQAFFSWCSARTAAISASMSSNATAFAAFLCPMRSSSGWATR